MRTQLFYLKKKLLKLVMIGNIMMVHQHQVEVGKNKQVQQIFGKLETLLWVTLMILW